MRDKYSCIHRGKKQYELNSRSKKEDKIHTKLQPCGSQNALNCENLKFDLEGANLMSSLVQRKTIETIREQTLLPHPNIRNDNTNIYENADDEPTFSRISLHIMAKTFNVLFLDISRLFVCIVVLFVFGYNIVLPHNES